MGRSEADFDIDAVVRGSNKFSGAEIEGSIENMCKRAYSRGESDEQALLLSILTETHPAAADANSEYVRQEEWARSRKFGSQTESASKVVSADSERRIIAVDKKNAIKNKENVTDNE